jgi:hypothetical protein
MTLMPTSQQGFLVSGKIFQVWSNFTILKEWLLAPASYLTNQLSVANKSLNYATGSRGPLKISKDSDH